MQRICRFYIPIGERRLSPYIEGTIPERIERREKTDAIRASGLVGQAHEVFFVLCFAQFLPIGMINPFSFFTP